MRPFIGSHACQKAPKTSIDRSLQQNITELIETLYVHIALTYDDFNYVKLGQGTKYLKEHL